MLGCPKKWPTNHRKTAKNRAEKTKKNGRMLNRENVKREREPGILAENGRVGISGFGLPSTLLIPIRKRTSNRRNLCFNVEFTLWTEKNVEKEDDDITRASR